MPLTVDEYDELNMEVHDNEDRQQQALRLLRERDERQRDLEQVCHDRDVALAKLEEAKALLNEWANAPCAIDREWWGRLKSFLGRQVPPR